MVFQRIPLMIRRIPNFFFPSESHSEALASLLYGINHRKGFVLILGKAGTGNPEQFLQQVGAAKLMRFKGVGEGNDLRFSAPGFTGGALEHNGQLIHLCAFQLEEAGAQAETNGRMSSASARRRHRQ